MTHKKERQINRIKSVYLFLKKNGPAKTDYLAAEFDCSLKTIQADLRILHMNRAVKPIKRGIWQAS